MKFMKFNTQNHPQNPHLFHQNHFSIFKSNLESVNNTDVENWTRLLFLLDFELNWIQARFRKIRIHLRRLMRFLTTEREWINVLLLFWSFDFKYTFNLLLKWRSERYCAFQNSELEWKSMNRYSLSNSLWFSD